MKIVTTFVPGLYAFQYEGNRMHELERVLEDWNNLEWLEEFFEEHLDDLPYFNLDVEDAIYTTMEETKSLEDWLLSLKAAQNLELDSFFKPLRNSDYSTLPLGAKKGKRRWLRLYALKIDPGMYAITGGAIKLTRTMPERNHTRNEITKLERCKNYLKENGVFDTDSFEDFQN